VKIVLLGYPGPIGGASTEAWDTLKLWRRAGWDVSAIPTWQVDHVYRSRLDRIGVQTIEASKHDICRHVAGANVVGMCNREAMKCRGAVRDGGGRFIWMPCMTHPLPVEATFFQRYGPPDALVFQSYYQYGELGQWYESNGWSAPSEIIRGAFDVDEWEFRPRPRVISEPFTFGRLARAAVDKWAKDFWLQYGKVGDPKRAVVMGVNDRVMRHIGGAPSWAECIYVGGMEARQFYRQLHCLAPINGKAVENWPRVGLEAMASGVPVVAEAKGGWLEMLSKDTGILTDDVGQGVNELMHDEWLRLNLAEKAREHVKRLSNPNDLIKNWSKVFQ